jgi:prephenate dehydrogenase
MAVIGTGLIGTSVALAASSQGVSVFLADRNRSAARTAAALGAGVAQRPTEPVDLAVLAVPPNQVGTLLAQLQRSGLACCYTDVASVKAEPERMALTCAPNPSCYIGGHPLAGGERSGPLAARADLFRGRPWALTPSRLTSDAALERGLELVDLCGAVPVVMPSRAHDDAVALTSHVPHLVASLMAARLHASPTQISELVGPGLRDVTRIAGGDSGLWGDILRINAAAVVDVVKDLHADLSRLVSALDVLAERNCGKSTDAMRTITDVLDRGIAGLAEIPGARRVASAGAVRVRVGVAERPGELSRLLDAVADMGLAAADAAVDADEGRGLTVQFAVPRDVAECMVAKLAADHWDVGWESD